MLTKVLITGASGQLGNAVINHFKGKYELLATDIINNTLNTNFTLLDISDPEQIKNVIEQFEPDVLINLAAYTDVDGCELYPEKAYLLNTKSIEVLTDVFNGYFIQISTDYIFDGKDGPYGEDDKPNPINVYGDSKLKSERILIENHNNYCILRTNVLFDHYPGTEASFIKWVIDSLSTDTSINVVNDQWNNPAWTHNLAEIIELCITKTIQGIYNYGGADYLNRLEFAQIIADIFNFDKTLIQPISTKSLDQLAKRPLKGGLKTNKIENDYNIKCAKLIDSLKEIKSRITT